MEPKIAFDTVTNLAVYGPLGILAMLCIVGMIAVYKDMRKERIRHKAELKELEAQHAAELNAERSALRTQIMQERAACEAERRESKAEYLKLEERYVTKTETQLEKYNQLVTALKDVLGSAMRRVRSKNDSGGPDGT